MVIRIPRVYRVQSSDEMLNGKGCFLCSLLQSVSSKCTYYMNVVVLCDLYCVKIVISLIGLLGRRKCPTLSGRQLLQLH